MMELVIDRNVPTRLYYIHVDLVDLRPTTAPTTRARPTRTSRKGGKTRGMTHVESEKAKEINAEGSGMKGIA